MQLLISLFFGLWKGEICPLGLYEIFNGPIFSYNYQSSTGQKFYPVRFSFGKSSKAKFNMWLWRFVAFFVENVLCFEWQLFCDYFFFVNRSLAIVVVDTRSVNDTCWPLWLRKRKSPVPVLTMPMMALGVF